MGPIFRRRRLWARIRPDRVERFGTEGNIRVPPEELHQCREPAVVERTQRQRQARVAAGEQADHRELHLEPTVRLSRPVDTARLLYEYELRRVRLLPHPLRRSAGHYEIPLGKFSLCRPSVELLCGA